MYREIIDNAKAESREKHQGVYYESHHIVPEFMFKNRHRKGPKGHLEGNPNHKDNLVLLTFREHLMCHYYLYKIYEGSRYGYSTGSALQFFFMKATGIHSRQIALTIDDEKFLNEMAYVREIGIKCISDARKGNMPVVDAITRESKGSVPTTHPKVLSGEWVHHSKGMPSPVKNRRDIGGECNPNYKEMTGDRRNRLFDCVRLAVVDDVYFCRKKLIEEIKKEFTEFRKVSDAWVINNFGSFSNLVEVYNAERLSNIVYKQHYRSKKQRDTAAKESRKYRWVTNGKVNLRLLVEQVDNFLENNVEYKLGRINVKN